MLIKYVSDTHMEPNACAVELSCNEGERWSKLRIRAISRQDVAILTIQQQKHWLSKLTIFFKTTGQLYHVF